MSNFSQILPCGLQMSVTELPEGVGSVKAHQYEFLWCVESNKVHGRGYAENFEKAKRKMLISAQIVLTESQIELNKVKE